MTGKNDPILRRLLAGLMVPTSDRDLVSVEEGAAALSGDDTPDSETWGVTRQTIDAAVSADQVDNAGDSTEISLSITSNRGDYDVMVTASRDGSDVSETTLLSVISSAARGTAGDGAVIVPAQADTTETLNFTGATSGNYAFTLAVTDTTASATASVEVTENEAVVEEPTSTATESPTRPPTESQTPYTSPTRTLSESPTESPATPTRTRLPGFGIAVALVALLAAALFAVRRD